MKYFQPLIENYFVHGFDTSNDENYILFKGKSLDENTMILTAEDNRNSLTDEERIVHPNDCLENDLRRIRKTKERLVLDKEKSLKLYSLSDFSLVFYSPIFLH